MTRQIIQSYEEARNDIGFESERGVEDYMAMKEDVLIVNAGAPQFGTVNPNGVVTSNYLRVYFDTSVSPAIMWVNPEIGADTGWIEVS